MIEKLRDDYLKSKTQIIVINRDREIIESDNILFNFELNTKIETVHPFFSIIEGMLLQPDTETIFNGVHIEYEGSKKIIEIIINSGNETINPFLIFIDFTYYYTNFQSLAQEKNESVLSFHLEELKTQQLKAENIFKNKFLANISHDLKTPIWGTNFYMTLLEETELTKNQIDMIKTVKEINNHVMRLVDDLLEISEVESGQLNIVNDHFNIVTSIDQVQKIIVPKIEEKKLEFKLKIDVNITTDLIGDKNRIIQILINLLDNSIKFTQTGCITLEVNEKEINQDEVVLIFKVTDTGSGIKTTNKEDVFTSFKKLHNTNIEGLGLGLSIVDNLVKMMKGTIDYTTKINEGTTFKIELPFSKK
jgi:two-component system, sensor histidine kinase